MTKIHKEYFLLYLRIRNNFYTFPYILLKQETQRYGLLIHWWQYVETLCAFFLAAWLLSSDKSISYHPLLFPLSFNKRHMRIQGTGFFWSNILPSNTARDTQRFAVMPHSHRSTSKVFIIATSPCHLKLLLNRE